MPKLGTFRDDAARDEFLTAYAAVETLWPLPPVRTDVPTSFGPTHVLSAPGTAPGTAGRAPFVLLHGFGGIGAAWHDDVEALAADRAVHAPDTIGAAGRSVQTAPLRGDADLARWFAEVLDGLGVERAHVVGESLGAWHAALLAIHVPHRLASVSLIEPNGVFARTPLRALLRMIRHGADRSEDGWRRMGEWLTPGVTLADEVVTLAKAGQGFRTSLGWGRSLTDAEIRGLTVPLLALYGGDSVLSNPPAATRRLARLAPQAEVEVYPGRGHGVKGEIRETVLARITGFARRHDHAGTRPA